MTKTTMPRGWVVLGAVLIQLCLGAIYAWSVFTPSLVDAGWTKTQTQIPFAVGLATFAVVMVMAGKKLPSLGPRKLAMASGVVLGAGYILAGVLGATNLWILTLCVGVVGGAGIGLGYVVPIAVGMRWFPDKKGLITGLAVAGFGFGALGWIKMAGGVNLGESLAWQGLLKSVGLGPTLMIYGAAFAALLLLGSVWMIFPPEGWTPAAMRQKATAAPQAASPASPAAAPAAEERVGLQILGTLNFYMIFLTFILSAGTGLMVIGIMKLYALEVLPQTGHTPDNAKHMADTAMAVFFSLANGIGRIAWGTMSDWIGRKRSILIMVTFQGTIVILFSAMAGYAWSLYLAAALIGFNFGGNFALFPTITADAFGAKNVGQNYPLVFLAYGVGGIAGPLLGGMLGDMGVFNQAFTFCGLAMIGSAAFMSMVERKNGSNQKNNKTA